VGLCEKIREGKKREERGREGKREWKKGEERGREGKIFFRICPAQFEQRIVLG
jgi:hypothetical protein